jgi:hypothetical protein
MRRNNNYLYKRVGLTKIAQLLCIQPLKVGRPIFFEQRVINLSAQITFSILMHNNNTKVQGIL